MSSPSRPSMELAREILLGRICEKHTTYDPTCSICFVRANVLYEITRANLDLLTPRFLVLLSRAIEAEMHKRKCLYCNEHIDMRRGYFNEEHAEFCTHECYIDWCKEHD